MLWSAEEMLDGWHQRVDIPTRARTAHKGLLQKRLEEDLCSIIPHVPPTTQSVKGTELNFPCKGSVHEKKKTRQKGVP